ncbi:MAG: GAF domain-containing protein [Bacteroidota bacterium]
MNNRLFKRLSTITIFLFIILVGVVLFLLINFENDVIDTGAVDKIGVSKLTPIIELLFIATGVLIAAGLLSIIFLLAAERYKTSGEEIVIEQFNDGALKNSADADESQENLTTSEGTAFKEVMGFIDKNLNSWDQQKVQRLLTDICNEVDAVQGAVYKTKIEGAKRHIELYSTYAFSIPDSRTISFEFGEGIAGQVAKEGKVVKIDQVPDGYLMVRSGLGEVSPTSLAIFPVLDGEDQTIGVVEIASFHSLQGAQVQTIEEIFNKVGEGLFSIPE